MTGQSKVKGVLGNLGEVGEQYRAMQDALSATRTERGISRAAIKSVTEESDLDAFIGAALLANKKFEAENRSRVVLRSVAINAQSQGTEELSAEQQRARAAAEKLLRVPRRPAWTRSMSKAELDAAEREAFLDWRRGLAELEQNGGLVLTPFERSLDIWRQLWRVIERSELVVQIVDARNPQQFRCKDLEVYVGKELGKANLILLNKADLLSRSQRDAWAAHFAAQGVQVRFFSARKVGEENERLDAEFEREQAMAQAAEAGDRDELTRLQREQEEARVAQDAEDAAAAAAATASRAAELGVPVEEATEEDDSDIVGREELLELLSEQCPEGVVGFVGYPNVGKSSTINALLGGKRAGVTSTPGKTKHFQTLKLSDTLTLCDCPGLVFPSFAATKAEMVLSGILSVHEMRDYRSPVALIARRIGRTRLERQYGFTVMPPREGEDPNRAPTAEEVMRAHAASRGFFATNGVPDESRSARRLVTDYQNGVLIFVHPPPTMDATAWDCNGLLTGKQQEPVTQQQLAAEAKRTARGVSYKESTDAEHAARMANIGAHTAGHRKGNASFKGRRAY